MYDDAYEMAGRCTEMFRDGVRDSFGASIVNEVLDPVRKEVGMLRAFHEEHQRHTLNIQQVLKEARTLVLDEGCQ